MKEVIPNGQAQEAPKAKASPGLLKTCILLVVQAISAALGVWLAYLIVY